METLPVILAIDTSQGPCSVAIVRGDMLIAEREEATAGSQSRVLVPMIEDTLKEVNLRYEDMTAIACTRGPGGFTGIRVGLATARAIALGAQKPLIGLSSLEVIASGFQTEGDVLAVIDAYRGQRYAQRFRINGALIAQSEPLLVDEKVIPALSHGAKVVQTLPQARFAALLAARKWAAGERQFPVDPLYIREPDAKLPSEPGLKVAAS